MDGLEEELDALERILCGQKKPDSLDFRLLKRLTRNFSEDLRIGEGGCGDVYKGVLPNGKLIAVKRLKKDHIIDEKMFLREVDSIIEVRHQNIVSFLGYCSEIKEKAVLMDGKMVMAEEREKLLCFPYISSGSLDKYLTDELRGFEWHTRYQIIKGICDGLLHLHKEKGIMHMDLKPANILIGDEMVPKITDFGVSRIDGKTQITSAERIFSRVYAAPEYIDTGVRSWKSDIYSLGVILIELVTGSRKLPNTTKVLRRWRHRWNKSSKHTPLSYLQVKKCLELAVSCQEKNPVNRPFIWDVVCELDKLDSWDGGIRESSIEMIISNPDDMLGTEPLELDFTLAYHKKQISCSIELTNDTEYYMAFKIARTSLLPFSIQPDKGIAAPRSKLRISVTLPAQEMTLLPNLCEGEFIVQSTRIVGSLTAMDITDATFNDEGGNSHKDDGDKVVDEVNITVLFDNMLHEEHQKVVTNLSAEMGSLGTSSQEVQQSMELSPYHHYEDPRHIEDLERILDGSQSPGRLPFSLLRHITADFSDERKIGRGGFSDVYKGILGDKIIAVKRLQNNCHTISDKPFHREVTTSMMVRHKNIVRFIGYCSHTEEEAFEMKGKFIVAQIRQRLFCYEYMRNGSLDNYITDELRGLEWHTRYQILLGICEGLQHLHMEKHIVHMDLKPANILLSGHMVPKITDFGLSRLLGNLQTVTTDILMTRGYSAPEYILNGTMSDKSDIYSLGAITIELVTGSKEISSINNVLRKWRHRWNKSAKYTPLWHHQVTKCLELALRCMDKNPIHRPDIWDIIQELNESDTSARSESADQLTNSCLDDMLGVEPLELHFLVELNRQQSCSIHLTNNTDHYIAFMIKNTFKSECITLPDKGVIPPRCIYSVTITLQAQEEEPGIGITHWDQEITVLSTRVEGAVTAADISEEMFTKADDGFRKIKEEADEVNLTVIFDRQ